MLDALDVGKISVGPPYFNGVFIPLTAPLAAAVGVGALARWKRDRAGITMANIYEQEKDRRVAAPAALEAV